MSPIDFCDFLLRVKQRLTPFTSPFLLKTETFCQMCRPNPGVFTTNQDVTPSSTISFWSNIDNGK